MKRKINIAITGLQAMDNPEPGMSLSRCLKNNPNYTLSGLSYSLYCTGNFSHSFDDIFLVPYPWDSPEQWLSRIGDIHKKKPIDVLIPSLDSEIVLFSSLESQLRDMGIKMYLPPIQAVKLRSKNFLPEWCTLEKIETPKTEVLSSKNAIEKIQGLIGFPCFIKGSIAGAALAHDAYEAKVLFDKISYLWGFPVIAQKKIFGSDFVLACVANDQHKILGSICVKKAATNSLGKCQMGIIVENDTVYKMAAHIVEKLQWRGALEIEVVYDPFRKKYFLIEINSRFPAWISISSQLSYPLVEQYVDLALGKEVAALKPCPSGYFFSRNTKETFFDAQDFATLATHGQLLEDDIYYEES